MRWFVKDFDSDDSEGDEEVRQFSESPWVAVCWSYASIWDEYSLCANGLTFTLCLQNGVSS